MQFANDGIDYRDTKTLGIVPARDGSKGLPGKNLRTLGGVPLWAIAAVQGLEGGCDRIIVSSNIPKLLALNWTDRISLHARPESLAGDRSPVEDTITDILETNPGYDAFVLLNPTHPFRRTCDIRACIDSVLDRGYPSATAVRRDYSYTVGEGAALPSMNRQERVPRIVVTGSIYAVRVPAFLEFKKLMIYGRVNRGCGIEVPAPHIDIDTADDFACAEVLHENGK